MVKLILSVIGVTLLIASAQASRPLIHSDTVDFVNNQKKGWRAYNHPRFQGVTMERAGTFLGLSSVPVSESVAPEARTLKRAVTQTTLPAEYDFRTQWPQCVQPVRDQQGCGGCWAFAASNVFGTRLCVATGGETNIVMSPQYPISCDTVDKGCNGGTLPGAWNFFAVNGEVVDSAYKFTSGGGSSGTCSLNASAKKYYSSTYRQLTTVTDMMTEIYTNGPIQVGFNVS
jgi:cathepsin B